MTATRLCDKLDPARFPNMSLQMAAILGFVLERDYTTPALAELVVTPTGMCWRALRARSDPWRTSRRRRTFAPTWAAWVWLPGSMRGSGRTMRHGSGTDLEWNWAGRGPRIVREFRGREDHRLC